MKKRTAIFLSFSVLVLLFSACENSSKKITTAQGAIVINLYHSWSIDTSRGKALNDIVDTFNTVHDGKIKVVVDINNDFPAYQEKVKAMISVNETPDIFHYNFNPNDLSRQESGKLMDFRPYMDSEWSNRFNQSDIDMLIINGQLNSIPFEKGGALLL
jgi:raffinose/stachyose/melibiose transport system substrate-binding protein